MNRNQRVVLLCAAGVILLMLLFPPFHFVIGSGVEFNLGYSFLLAPPLYQYNQPGSVNLGMLLAQWVGVAVVGGFVAYVFKD